MIEFRLWQAPSDKGVRYMLGATSVHELSDIEREWMATGVVYVGDIGGRNWISIVDGMQRGDLLKLALEYQSPKHRKASCSW